MSLNILPLLPRSKRGKSRDIMKPRNQSAFQMSLPFHFIRSSELVAQTNTRVVCGCLVAGCSRQSAGKQESAGETVLHLRPHDTGIGIEVLRKAPIGNEGNRIQRSAAAAGHNGVTATCRIAAV